MATFNILLLAAAFLSAQAFPQDPLPYRNTIFDDEKLEGGVFQYVDQFNDVALYTGSNNPFRLPTTTRPQHYDVLWAVQIPGLTFSGDVTIQVYPTQPNVDEIIIHAHDLNITSLSLTQGSTVIPIQYYTLEPEYHFLRIKLLNSVLNYNLNSRVIYDLSISFEAPLRTDMYGIYQSWFRDNATNPDEQISWMASTQFQATAARFAFPCYDEPSFKATFNITIRRPTTHRSWSCTRQQQTVNSSIVGYEDDIYYPTPIMSTYLLALIVAEYESQRFPTDTSSDLMYEVIARPNAIQTNQGDYAFNVGIDLLGEMSNHTDYNFFTQHPFLKMTQAAIPDFGAGAMENWGLLTYREAYLLYDPEHTNGYFQQLIAYILSHEIAHMWFGNLVTCDWWDTLWLNEGFARYYQYFLTDWVETDMGLGIRFIPEQMHTSLLSDSSNNPHPLTNPGVGSPASVSAMFSTISYNKGAAIIRMTEHLLGFNVHRQGLRNYLIERQFDTAQPIHLFQALQTAAVQAGAISEYGPDFNFIDYYRSWTEQGGHPVLNVDVNHQTGLMTIYQRRFNINSGYATAATNWIVPITFSTASNPNFSNTKPSHVINEAISVVDRGSVGDEWVIFNKQQTGFYRVNYDDYTWNLNIMALRGPQRTIIHEFNKAQIVNDVFQFARSGIMTYNRAFNIISFLENETEYTPWVAGITGFNWIRNRIIGSPLQAGFEQRVAAWATTAMSSLTYYPQPDETFMRSYLRYMLAPFMCNLNVAECRTAATQQFQDLYVNGTEVPVDSRNWVYCNALRDGSPAVFDFLWQRFLTHNVYTEKILLLQVLGCTPHQESLYTFLDAIVQENYIIRPQDYTTAFNSAVSGNEGNTQLVFQYIQENYENVTNAFGSPNTPLSYISSRLRTIERVNEFQQWVDNNSQLLGTSFQAVRNGAENSRSAIAWASTVEADITSYLTTGNSPVQLTTPATVVVVTPPTVTAPPLNEPSTPTLPEVPDSANTSALSMLTLIVALIAKFALL